MFRQGCAVSHGAQISHLNLCVGFAGVDMITAVDQEPDKLPGAGTPELGGIVLLLDQAGLPVDHETESSNLSTPVDRVTLPIEENQEAPTRKGASTDQAPPSVEVESPCRGGRAGGGKRILDIVVDKVDAENSLQDVLRRD